MKELVIKNVPPKYVDPSPAHAEAMQALVGIRANDKNPEDSTAVIRRLRQGTRLLRLSAQ